MWTGPDWVMSSLFSSLHWGVESFCCHWTAHFKPVKVKNKLLPEQPVQSGPAWGVCREGKVGSGRTPREPPELSLNSVTTWTFRTKESRLSYCLYWSQCCVEATLRAPQRHLLVVLVEMTSVKRLRSAGKCDPASYLQSVWKFSFRYNQINVQPWEPWKVLI